MTKQIDRSFTQNLLSVIKETKVNVSNIELVEKIARNMAHAFEKYPVNTRNTRNKNAQKIAIRIKYVQSC
jgi:hypothetical protein